MGAPTPSPKPLINLQLGWPSPRLFANSAILAGAQTVLSSPSETAAALVYGPHAGHPPLRSSIASWLTSVYTPAAGPVPVARVAITNGASGNLANVLLKFTDAGVTRRIFMVEPTYFLACPIFEDAGLGGRLRGVPEGPDGIDIAFLRREMEAAEREEDWAAQTGTKKAPEYPKIYKYVVYVVPTFANPSAKTMSVGCRRDLVALAREFDALVVSDDVYDFLTWPEQAGAQAEEKTVPPPRLVDLDRAMPGGSEYGNTVSNGSFSKVIGPGIRVGWAEGTEKFVEALAEVGSSSSGGAPSHLTSTFVDKMLRSGSLQAHIADVLVPTYQARYHTLLTAIRTHLVPLGVTVEANNASSATAGGFFTYLQLPADLPAAKAVAAVALQEYRVRIAFGHMFVVAGDDRSVERAEEEDGFARGVRLCWAWHEEDELREGVERLAEAIAEVRRRVERGESVGEGVKIGIR